MTHMQVAGLVIVGIIAIQRLAEVVLAGRNTTRLLSEGGVEYGRAHYPVMVLLHVCWIVACGVAAYRAEAIYAVPLLFFVLMQFARIWVIASLGPYWTTRIITVPGAPLVKKGPYRFMRHPNYAVVTAEIALLPLAFEAYWVAVIFSALNAIMLWVRIRVENETLRDRA